MTQELDNVSVEQAALDGAQGIETGDGESEYITKDMWQRAMSDMGQLRSTNTSLSTQVRGLQGRIDKGLDAIRRDSEAAVRDRQQQEFLGSLNEEERPAWEKYLALNRNQAPPAEEQVDIPPNTGEGDQWEHVFNLVRDFGLDPNTPGINYTILTSDLSDRDRQKQFLNNLKQVERQAARAPNGSAAAPPAPAQRQGFNPPPVPSPRGAVTYQNADAVRDAFLTDQIDRPTYERDLAKFGELA